ncbi:hypothetical protein A9Q81_27630 [Gammaproteobacteria bacterium 42_54_T18]|nr:hypothetical protein A9Q81_27630 [Gammaproteobacteria bacterium 42_54_T18]
MTLPNFKYHDDPVKSGVFEKHSGSCSCCGEKKGWRYVGPFYTYIEIENICPWCIENGSAASKFDGEFVDDGALEEVGDETKLDELLRKTPGYYSAQGDPWPVHCKDFCKLLGRTNWAELKFMESELEFDIQQTLNDNGLNYEEMVKELSREHSPLWAHLFVCNHCNTHRFVADYE